MQILKGREKQSTWLHTKACKYNLSALGTYFGCEGVKRTYLLTCLLACLLACVLACLRACVLPCLRACVLACLRACVRACVLACLLACLRACVLACVRACVLACVRACLLTCLLACLLSGHGNGRRSKKPKCAAKYGLHHTLEHT